MENNEPVTWRIMNALSEMWQPTSRIAFKASVNFYSAKEILEEMFRDEVIEKKETRTRTYWKIINNRNPPELVMASEVGSK